MARCFLLLCVAAFIFVLVQTGDGLKCYHCRSTENGDCHNPRKNSSLIKECERDHVCYIRNQTSLDDPTTAPTIVRGCILKENCVSGTDGHYNYTCNVCESNLCNSSSSMVPSFFIISIVAVVFAKMYL